MENGQVINHLESGVRLPKPQRCPPNMYSLLSHCWAYEPQGRPAFNQLVCNLRHEPIVCLSVPSPIAHLRRTTDLTAKYVPCVCVCASQ